VSNTAAPFGAIPRRAQASYQRQRQQPGPEAGDVLIDRRQ
jgi:hypothetical protein